MHVYNKTNHRTTIFFQHWCGWKKGNKWQPSQLCNPDEVRSQSTTACMVKGSTVGSRWEHVASLRQRVPMFELTRGLERTALNDEQWVAWEGMNYFKKIPSWGGGRCQPSSCKMCVVQGAQSTAHYCPWIMGVYIYIVSINRIIDSC